MRFALSVLAFVGAAAAQTVGSCNGDTEPNYNDCNTIMKRYPVGPGYVTAPDNGCAILAPPKGVHPNSLNCRICVFSTNGKPVSYGFIYDAYTVIHTDCPAKKAGGSSTVQNAKVHVTNNPDYNGNPNRAARIRDIERGRGGSVLSPRVSDTCVNGHGKLSLLQKDVDVNAPKIYWKTITRLASGAQFMYQKSYSKTVGVDVSVSVSAGFFDLFEASTSVTTSYSHTVQSTEGVTITNKCPNKEQATVYLVPQVDIYYLECEQTKKQIVVYNPGKIQNTYTYECLGG